MFKILTRTHKFILQMKKYFLSILLAFIFCCSSFGQSNIVFVEDFPLNAATQRTCGTATVSSLVSGRGYTTYTYVGNNSDNCKLDEDYYAIANHSYWSFWNNRTQVNEHTGMSGSGAMMINAAADVNKYFYTLQLEGLCPDTQYEFSAW